MKFPSSPRLLLLLALAATAAGLLVSCTHTPLPPEPPQAPATPAVVVPSPGTDAPAVTPGRPVQPSAATNPRSYRADAAAHIYSLNADRIWKGRLPPMLHAIGVLDVELDARGQVRGLSWRRAPKHAPDVMAEIEKMVRSAAPYPAPARMGKVVYTDVWLWHESGRFQLDTLTEGQD